MTLVGRWGINSCDTRSERAHPGGGEAARMARRTGESTMATPSWQFLQCFGERVPGEEVQEGARTAPPRRQWTWTRVGSVG